MTPFLATCRQRPSSELLIISHPLRLPRFGVHRVSPICSSPLQIQFPSIFHLGWPTNDFCVFYLCRAATLFDEFLSTTIGVFLVVIFWQSHLSGEFFILVHLVRFLVHLVYFLVHLFCFLVHLVYFLVHLFRFLVHLVCFLVHLTRFFVNFFISIFCLVPQTECMIQSVFFSHHFGNSSQIIGSIFFA